jgi:hypothetical protein
MLLSTPRAKGEELKENLLFDRLLVVQPAVSLQIYKGEV